MLLVSYMILILIKSTVVFDLKHLFEAVKLALPLWVIFQTRLAVSVKVLNGLFLIVLLGCIVMYDSAYSDYGYLPGQTDVNLHQGLWWRVSIWNFKTPPYSAAFSILVLFANIFLNKNSSKYLYIILAMYFIVLSGSRTGYLIVIVGLSLILLREIFSFKYRRIYVLVPVVAFIGIFLLQFWASMASITIDNEIFGSVLRANNDSTETLSNLSSRFVIIAEHYSLFVSSAYPPLFGIGSDVYSSPVWTSNGGIVGGSADSFISHMLVRDGVGFFFLSGVFFHQFYVAMLDRDFLRYLILVFLLVYCIGYGAWLNFTSPVFVLFCGFLFSGDSMNVQVQQKNP